MRNMLYVFLIFGLLQGCANKVLLVPTDPSIDTTFAEGSLSDEQKIAMLTDLLGLKPTGPNGSFLKGSAFSLDPCILNFSNRTVGLTQVTSGVDLSTVTSGVDLPTFYYPLSATTLRYWQSPVDGYSLLDLFATSEREPMCRLGFTSDHIFGIPTPWSDDWHNRVSKVAAILKSYGVEVNGQRLPVNEINAATTTSEIQPSQESIASAPSKAHTPQQRTLEDQLKRDADLPEQVKYDKYKLALTNHMEREHWQDALFYFELLDFLNAELDDSFLVFRGEALLKTNQPRQAIAKFHEYINKAGAKGEHYTRALELTTQAEERL